ncbi:hypothetical protein F2Q70_00042249 [Brassica cretica]|uniref:Uncharacterized protein n=1 Tax=Brassica cretica TaxID=69181 RepID=A0A8S9KLS8_BRACR|nr:hypothetical protein F2Q70_00042249 [Brassica cretica]
MLQFSDRSLRLIKGSESAISDTVKSEDQRFLCVLRREKEELSGERRERGLRHSDHREEIRESKQRSFTRERIERERELYRWRFQQETTAKCLRH